MITAMYTMIGSITFIPCSIFPLSDVTTVFLVVLCIILFAPLLLNRLHIPHIVGMILAGVLLGSHGLNILSRDSSFETFGQIGLYYIMFLAGIEMNLEELKKNISKSFTFGLLTFSIPFSLGLVTGRCLLGFSWEVSVLLSSVLASHTLVAYPIIGRYGLSKQESVILSVGATMITLTISLFVLAGLSNSVTFDNNFWFWPIFLSKCALFILFVVLIFPRLARWFFCHYSDNVMQFVFVLALLCLGALLAGMAGLDGIFGAFLTGLVLNRYIPHVSPLMNRIEFVGNALFIPYFLISVGMIINIHCLFDGWGTLRVTLFVIAAATLSKWLAAVSTQKLFGMNRGEQLMMFGLSNAHAAGALAIIMMGVNITTIEGQPLVSDELLNSVVILILVSCIISTIVTEGASHRLIKSDENIVASRGAFKKRESIMIAYSNPIYTATLTNLALLLRNPTRDDENHFTGVNVTLNNNDRDKAKAKGEKLLDEAAKIAASADVTVTTQKRVGTNIAQSLLHAALECEASNIIMGMHQKSNLLDSFLGTTIKDLIYGTNKQVMIIRCNRPINTLRRLVVFVPDEAQFEAGFYKWVEQLSRMSEQLGCQIFFYTPATVLDYIMQYTQNHRPNLRVQGVVITSWDDFMKRTKINPDHLLVIISPRHGSVSWKEYIEHLPAEVTQAIQGVNLLMLYPDQFGDAQDYNYISEVAKPHKEQLYNSVKHWINKHINK